MERRIHVKDIKDLRIWLAWADLAGAVREVALAPEKRERALEVVAILQKKVIALSGKTEWPRKVKIRVLQVCLARAAQELDALV